MSSANRIKPLPEEIFHILSTKKNIYFFEEGMRSGGIGEKIGSMLMEKGIFAKYHITAVNDSFAPQASVSDLISMYKLDKDSIVNKILEN